MVTTDKNVSAGICIQSIDSNTTPALRLYSDPLFVAQSNVCWLEPGRNYQGSLPEIAGIAPHFFSILKNK